jgi:hypothetical protein
MGFLDRILGRTAPPAPDLDRLFAVPEAAVSLQVALELRPTGVGAVCFRAAEGGAFGETEAEVTRLLDTDAGPRVERSTDSYGFTWLVVRHDAAGVAGVVTDLHAVNASLQDAGFGPSLLCTTIGFTGDAGRRLALVYLYKRGTFYPFAPTGEQQRDNAYELQVRAVLTQDLTVEPELTRWFALWGAPGL